MRFWDSETPFLNLFPIGCEDMDIRYGSFDEPTDEMRRQWRKEKEFVDSLPHAYIKGAKYGRVALDIKHDGVREVFVCDRIIAVRHSFRYCFYDTIVLLDRGSVSCSLDVKIEGWFGSVRMNWNQDSHTAVYHP